LNEKHFQQEFRESIKFFYPFCHYHKIPDPTRKDFEGESYTIKRPYDAFYIYKDDFVAFEYKMIKKPESFAFNRVDDNQIYHLLEVNQSFNVGLIVVNYRFSFTEKQMKKYNTDKSKHNFCIIFEIKEFMKFKYFYYNYLNKKSIDFEYIWDLYNKKANSILEWIKIEDKWVWDVRKIFKYFFR